MKLAHALLAALKNYGAGEIFGIPGDFALPFFREIERAGILPLHTLSHEPAVGFAADAAARYRGLRERLRRAVTGFEASHPELARRIEGAIDTLAMLNL